MLQSVKCAFLNVYAVNTARIGNPHNPLIGMVGYSRLFQHNIVMGFGVRRDKPFSDNIPFHRAFLSSHKEQSHNYCK